MQWFSTDGDAEPGLLAFGDHPVGIIAIGHTPTGVIAIGVMARGFLAIGAIALGAIAVAVGAAGGGRVLVCGLGAGGVVTSIGSGYGLYVDGEALGLLGDYEPTVWWWTKALVLSGGLAALMVLAWGGWSELFP